MQEKTAATGKIGVEPSTHGREVVSLSRREILVLEFVSEGVATQAVARRLFSSPLSDVIPRA